MIIAENLPVKDFKFWKNLTLTALFFTITPLTIFISLFGLFYFSNDKPESQEQVTSKLSSYSSGAQVFASLPNSIPTVTHEAILSDSRPELVRQYLDSYNSVLSSHSDLIIETADKYGLDFRLLPAIAQQESNLCKIIPENSYNCWGWGIHSQGTLRFTSFEEGIETVSKGIKAGYIDKGLKTPEQIMGKYTPSSPSTWARGVEQFMGEME